MSRRIPLVVMLLALSLAAGRLSAAPPAAPPNLPAIVAALAGTWQSTNDPKFSREFDPDGTEIERYEGDSSATVTGRWMLFLGSAPPPGLAGRTFDAKSIYLKLNQNGDVLLFALVGLSRSDMKMVYLERGNLLTFARLK